jgi:endonuclease YncB( thermonuclease family)
MRILKIFSILFLLSVVLWWCLSAHKTISCRVTGIKDGDTIEILTGARKSMTVRLHGIDAPEKSQPFSQKSKENLSKLIYGKQVRLYTYGNDRYGRLIADVFIDTINVNYLQVAVGLAWHYKQYSDDETLAYLQEQARRQKLGLWQEADPVAPWQYRKNKRKGGEQVTQ